MKFLFGLLLLSSVAWSENNLLWGFRAVQAAEARSLMKNKCSNSKILIAVIDTGIDFKHPALSKSKYPGYDFVANTNKITDSHGHGTHIAGIISGNSRTFKGICPGIKIMSIKFYNPSGSGEENGKNTRKAIQFAIDHKANIINYSAGGAEFDQEEFNILQKAQSKGILVVTAAGNEHSDADKILYYPAAYNLDNIISVASIDQENKLLPSSNWGTIHVHLAAPGYGIVSTFPNNGYGFLTGTSQAAAFVTGLAALLKTENPKLNYSEIKYIINKTSIRNSNLLGKVRNSGVVNAKKAIEFLHNNY